MHVGRTPQHSGVVTVYGRGTGTPSHRGQPRQRLSRAHHGQTDWGQAGRVHLTPLPPKIPAAMHRYLLVCSPGASVSRCLAKTDCHDVRMLRTVGDIRRRQRPSGADQQQRRNCVPPTETVVNTSVVQFLEGRLQGEQQEYRRETANLISTTRRANSKRIGASKARSSHHACPKQRSAAAVVARKLSVSLQSRAVLPAGSLQKTVRRESPRQPQPDRPPFNRRSPVLPQSSVPHVERRRLDA